MNNPDVQEGAYPADPALLADQPPNPLLMQPPPGIGDEDNYRAFYTDQSKDPHHQGNYRAVMAEFEVASGNPALGNPALFTPQQLATQVYQSGDQGCNMSFVLHCRPDHAPTEAPGYVNIYHRVSRFAPRIGMLPPHTLG